MTCGQEVNKNAAGYGKQMDPKVSRMCSCCFRLKQPGCTMVVRAKTALGEGNISDLKTLGKGSG